jgi:hypothetical protein
MKSYMVTQLQPCELGQMTGKCSCHVLPEAVSSAVQDCVLEVDVVRLGRCAEGGPNAIQPRSQSVGSPKAEVALAHEMSMDQIKRQMDGKRAKAVEHEKTQHVQQVCK